jgi:hypothetical protein
MKIKRKTLDLFKKWTIGTLAVFFVCFFTYIFFVSGTFTIKNYDLVGVPEEYTNQIQNGLKEIATHKFLLVLPSNRVFSYRGLKMKTLITSTLPNTESVTIGIRGLHTLKITATQFSPLFKQDATHAITKDGIVYQESADLSQYPTLTLASSTTVSQNKDGIISSRILGLDHDTLLAISALIQKVNPVLFQVETVTIDQYGDVTFIDNRGVSMLKFSTSTDPVKIWSNIVSSIDTEPLKTKLADKTNNLSYLDARFGNKVFYKFTNDKDTAIIRSTNATSTATSTTVTR